MHISKHAINIPSAEHIRSIELHFSEFNDDKYVMPLVLYVIIFYRAVFELYSGKEYISPIKRADDILQFIGDVEYSKKKPLTATPEIVADLKYGFWCKTPKELDCDERDIFCHNCFEEICRKYEKNLRKVNAYYNKKHNVNAIKLFRLKPLRKNFLLKTN